jgi:hypothetical protein
MAKSKLPARVDGEARPKTGQKEQAQDLRASDLAEIVKRSGEYSAHYGKLWGGFIQLSLANAATGRRPFLWGGMVSLGTVACGILLKYGLPKLPG